MLNRRPGYLHCVPMTPTHAKLPYPPLILLLGRSRGFSLLSRMGILLLPAFALLGRPFLPALPLQLILLELVPRRHDVEPGAVGLRLSRWAHNEDIRVRREAHDDHGEAPRLDSVFVELAGGGGSAGEGATIPLATIDLLGLRDRSHRANLREGLFERLDDV